jgi:hypothetical protein
MRKLKLPLSETKYLGDEPIWVSDQTSETSLVYAYNWYRAALEPKVARLVLADYMQHAKQYTQDDIELLDYIEDWRFDVTNLPALGRMIMRGLTPTARQQERLDTEIPLLLQRAREKRDAARESARRLKVKIVPAAPKDPAGDAMNMIECALDTGAPVDVTGILKMHQPRPADLKNDTERMARLVEEVQHAFDRTDEQCVEAYRSYSKKQLRDMLARYAGVLQAINLYCSANIKPPKVRKARPKSPEKLVAKLRYLDRFDELGLVSIDPKDIIGATEVLIYHPARRYVYRYVAPLGSKLSVRRSMIDGYDPKLSFRKKLRLPDDTLKRLLSGGIKSVAKTFEAIKTKPAEANGTVNAQMLILRVGK